jgi:hypothetical protein
MKLIIIRTTAFALLVTFYACTNKFSEEIKLTNELTAQLDQNDDNKNIDIKSIKDRASEIEILTETFRTQYTDTVSKELGDNLTRLNVLRKIYTRNVGYYAENTKNQVELQEQLANLITDLENNKLTKEEFKAYFKTEKDDITQHIDQCKRVRSNLYEVEPEYTRLMAYLQPFIADFK